MAHIASERAYLSSFRCAVRALPSLHVPVYKGRAALKATLADTAEVLDTEGWGDLLDSEDLRSTKGLRVRQHINPLRTKYQTPRPAPDWSSTYADCSLPLILDIGSAGGRFVLAMAKKHPGHNFLGLDIRNPLIERANEWARYLGREGHILFEQANATISLESLLTSYPGPLTLATIQFPDPHFKKRHKKRRIVQPSLIAALSKLMVPQGRVFLQSDIEDVAGAMRDEFELYGSGAFQLAPEHTHSATFLADQTSSHATVEGEGQPGDGLQEEEPADSQESSQLGGEEGTTDRRHLTWEAAGYLQSNPLGVPTERELQTMGHNKPVYRVLLTRK